jgi:hypothetical protein
MNRIFLLTCGFFILVGCRQAENLKMQKIEEMQKLPGIVEIKLNEGGSVTMVCGFTPVPAMHDKDGNPTRQATLKPGQKWSVGDGRHSTVVYQFQSAEGDKIRFDITSRFDARSFGNGETEESKKVLVRPYSNAENASESEVAP